MYDWYVSFHSFNPKPRGTKTQLLPPTSVQYPADAHAVGWISGRRRCEQLCFGRLAGYHVFTFQSWLDLTKVCHSKTCNAGAITLVNGMHFTKGNSRIFKSPQYLQCWSYAFNILWPVADWHPAAAHKISIILVKLDRLVMLDNGITDFKPMYTSINTTWWLGAILDRRLFSKTTP